MGKSEIEEEFWSQSESEVDVADSEDEEFIFPPALSRNRDDEQHNSEKKLEIKYAEIVSFKQITKRKNSSNTNSEAIDAQSNRSVSNIRDGQASERKGGLKVPVFSTKMIFDIKN